jgi:hypothetical protein
MKGYFNNTRPIAKPSATVFLMQDIRKTLESNNAASAKKGIFLYEA